MPQATIRGLILNYDLIGDSGPWVALTPGSRRNFSEFIPLGERMAGFGCRVLLHDRRNCGASEVGIEALGSENEIWADDLHALGQHLGATSMYVGGSSAGARLAILFALRHPDATRGLLLWRVTGGAFAAESLAEAYYGAFIKAAQAGGMAAVCASEHFAECIRASPSNRARLMAMDPAEFIRVMTFWRDDFLRSASLPVIGATEAQLASIKAPTCLIAGNDRIHAPKAARNLSKLIPNSEFHDSVVDKRDEGNLLDEWDRKEWKDKEGVLADMFVDFLKRHEPAIQSRN
jgi:pimeloyl-ACP methyl ester carboxylesterase